MSLFEKWRKLDFNEIFNKAAKSAFNKYKKVTIELNQAQLDKGLNRKGKKLSPYSDKYKKVRQKAGLQTSKKDLKFNGDFRRDFYSIAFDTFVEWGSKHRLADILEGQYPNIYGIPKKDMPEFIEKYLIPEIKIMIKAA